MIKKLISLFIAACAIIFLILAQIFTSYSTYLYILALVFVILQFAFSFIAFSRYEFNALTTDKNNEELMKFVSNKFYRLLINKENKIYYLSKKARKELNVNIFDSILTYIPERIFKTEFKEVKVEFAGNLYMYYRVMNTIYLWPINEQEKYKKLYSESVNGVGYLVLDNYRELTENLTEAERTEILSKYYRLCEQTFAKYNIIAKRIGTTKYFIVATIGSYRKFKNSGFEVLAQIPSIYQHRTESLTGSIGFSINQYNNSTVEDERNAQSALNLAIERGGNQTVEHINNEMKIIGGNTQTNTIRSKVKVRIFAKELFSKIDDASEVLIFGHYNVDMDCFSSLVAMHQLVKYIDPDMNVKICMKIKNCSYDVRNAFELLSEDIQRDFILHPNISKKTLAIVLDVSTLGNVYEGKEIVKTDDVVVIDHHLRDNDDYLKQGRSLLDVNASSTAELIIEILQYGQYLKKLPQNVLDYLYAGIIIDTDNLLQKVSTNTFEALSSLVRNGANVKSSFSLRQDSYDFVKEKNNVIASAQTYKDKFVIARSPYVWSNTKIAKTANELLQLKEFECSFVIAQTKQGIKISARSNGSVNVANMMKELKGGGHATIAATLLPSSTVNVEEKIKKIIDKYN